MLNLWKQERRWIYRVRLRRKVKVVAKPRREKVVEVLEGGSQESIIFPTMETILIATTMLTRRAGSLLQLARHRLMTTMLTWKTNYLETALTMMTLMKRTIMWRRQWPAMVVQDVLRSDEPTGMPMWLWHECGLKEGGSIRTWPWQQSDINLWHVQTWIR